MSGYYGYSMSNNAVSAYLDGEKPLSKWTKKEIIFRIENECEINFPIEKLKKVPLAKLKEICLKKSSWHHTSSYYNSTDFYDIDIAKIESFAESDLDGFLECKKPEIREEKAEKWLCEFLEWSGTRAHPKATKVQEIGVIRGNWFYRENGTKKSINANGFYKIERV